MFTLECNKEAVFDFFDIEVIGERLGRIRIIRIQDRLQSIDQLLKRDVEW